MTAAILAEMERLRREKGRLSISVVGAGGKTSLMRYLARHIQGTCVCTTSTKLSADETALFDQHIIWESEDDAIPDITNDAGNVLITGIPVVVNGNDKLSGLTEKQLIVLEKSCTEKQFPLIIEADGSKRRPLKAPADWEPVVPAFSDLVIVVVGLAGLMKPLNEENVFRSQIFAQLTELDIGQEVDLPAILRYLKHPLGGLKGIPEKAKKFVLFNLARFEYPELVDRDLIEEELGGVFVGFFIEDIDLLS